MVSLISDLGLIGLTTLNSGTGVVGGDLLRADSALNFATESNKTRLKGDFVTVEISLANVAGFKTTKMSLTVADTAVAAAIEAAKGIRDTVVELAAVAIQAEADNIDTEIRNEMIVRFETLRDRLAGQVDQATVGNANFIAENAPDANIQDVENKIIKIEAQDLSAQGLGISHVKVTLASEATASHILLKQALITLATRLDGLESSATEVGTALDTASRLTHLHVEKGVKDLIDPDITLADAELRALDIRQRLGEHALAIANVNGFSFVGLVRPDQ